MSPACVCVWGGGLWLCGCVCVRARVRVCHCVSKKRSAAATPPCPVPTHVMGVRPVAPATHPHAAPEEPPVGLRVHLALEDENLRERDDKGVAGAQKRVYGVQKKRACEEHDYADLQKTSHAAFGWLSGAEVQTMQRLPLLCSRLSR